MKSLRLLIILVSLSAMSLTGCFSGMIAKMQSAMRVPPVATAIYRSDTTEIKRLIDSSRDVLNEPWFAGMRTTLAMAPSGWMVDWLIANGANPNLRLDDGSTPLTDVASRETDVSDVIVALVKQGATINNANTEGYRSRAARQRDLNRQNPAVFGMGAPTVSVKKGGVDLVQFYQVGRTPLHTAALAGVASNVKALVAQGASIETTEGNDKLTPLHLACAMVNTDAAEALVESGANVNAKTDDDETPLKLVNASESTHDKAALIAYLKAHGAKE